MSVRKHYFKDKEARALLKDFSVKYGIDDKYFGSKPKVELAEVDAVKLIFVDGKPLMLQLMEKLFPTLIFLEALKRLPHITVDVGAIPHICNGADVMAPGIRKIEGAFQSGDTVVIIDEKYGKPIALGLTMVSSETMKNMKKGKVVENVHFVGDKVWRFIKGR
jgi:PUA domain protein